MPNGHIHNSNGYGFQGGSRRSQGGRRRGKRGGRARAKQMVVRGTIAKVFYHDYDAPVAADVAALDSVLAAILGDDAAAPRSSRLPRSAWRTGAPSTSPAST